MAAVSMSSATTPSSAELGHAVSLVGVSPTVVSIFPCGVPSPRGAGRYSAPVALCTTTSGRMSVPIGVSFSIPPVIPTTTT